MGHTSGAYGPLSRALASIDSEVVKPAYSHFNNHAVIEEYMSYLLGTSGLVQGSLTQNTHLNKAYKVSSLPVSSFICTWVMGIG